MQELLGEGSYGRVYRGETKPPLVAGHAGAMMVKPGNHRWEPTRPPVQAPCLWAMQGYVVGTWAPPLLPFARLRLCRLCSPRKSP